jgi:hypothetical protein
MMIQRHPHGRDLVPTAGDATEERGNREPKPAPHLTGEEVRRQQDIEVETDEFVPRGGRLPLWRWWNAMMLEDIPVTVQVVKTGIMPRRVLADRFREAETEPLPPARRLHRRR